LADAWGRKRVLLLGAALALANWCWLLFAEGVLQVSGCFFLFALSFALQSGTDEALLYDTHRELGNADGGLQKLAFLEAASRVFKMISPAIAGVAVTRFSADAFPWLLGVDIATSFAALVCLWFLTEPVATTREERLTAHILRDAWRAVQRNPLLRRGVLGKNMVFVAAFVVWRFQDQYFTSMGVSLMVFGAAWSVMQAFLLAGNLLLPQLWTHLTLNERINRMNLFNASASTLCLFLAFWGWPLALLFVYCVNAITGAVSIPWYQKMLHHHSASTSRATTASLANMWQNLLALPTYGLVFLLLPFTPHAPWVLALLLCALSITIGRVALHRLCKLAFRRL
jgi:predicted outer membrane lipoprotein